MQIKSIVLEEYQKALAENRQPNCPYCHATLDIEKSEGGYSQYIWRDNKYEENHISYIRTPFCLSCLERDWDFTDSPSWDKESKTIYVRLGLKY